MAHIIKDTRIKQGIALLLFILMVIEPCFIYRARCQTMPDIRGHYGSRSLPSVAANALPDLRNIVQGVGDIVQNSVESRMDIHQNQQDAILEWNTFNIGTDAQVHFDQQGNADWRALNRIFDANPSRIFGQLTADGKVYLINQNGILFGPDSRVNVHTLVASSLNLSNDDFLDELLNFNADNYMGVPDYLAAGVVSNHGNMETQTNGAVFLIGSMVENAGAIDSPFGQVGLVAGTDVALYLDPYNPSRTALFVDVNHPPEGATAVNFEGARISADVGTAGMYGCVVNQEGLIRSVTAVQKNGQIELQASRRVVTGPDSLTTCPISNDSTRVHQSFEFNGGRIEITGLSGESVEQIEHNGRIEAPAGSVLLDADKRVYLGEQSGIDVSGSWIDRPVEDTQVTLQLNSVELRDEQLQKGGVLQGETIYVNPLEGSNIGDISGALAYEEKSAQERSTYGGEVIISAPSGDIIQRQGSEIDFSGGGVNYQDGTLMVTQLRSGYEIYDISEAPDHIQYDEVFTTMEQVRGYVEGDDAGSLKLIARGVVLDGTLDGSAVQGPYQTEMAEPVYAHGNQTLRGVALAERGTLVIGENVRTASSSDPDYVVDEIIIAGEVLPLPSDFTPESDLKAVTETGPSGATSPYVSEYSDAMGPLYRSTISAETLNAAGLGTLQLSSNTRLTIQPDAQILMASEGKFQATARRIEHYGNITVPSGIVDFILGDTFTSPANFQYDPTRQVTDLMERIYVDDGSVISVAGDRIDNFTYRYERPVQVAFTDGGAITLIESTGRDRPADIIVKKDAQIDVSGGYEIRVNGDQQGGDGGILQISGETVVIEPNSEQGNLIGMSVLGNNGGTIDLHANYVKIKKAHDPSDPESFQSDDTIPDDFTADDPIPDELKGTLILSDSQFNGSGFSKIIIRSHTDLDVSSGVRLAPSYEKWPVNMLMQGLGSNSLKAEPYQMGLTRISLISGADLVESNDNDMDAAVNIARDAVIAVAPEGMIDVKGTDVNLEGTLQALSGQVDVEATYGDIFLGNSSRIIARGYNRPEDQPLIEGLPIGYVPVAAGDIRLTAQGNPGIIQLSEGSLLDVSGPDKVVTHVLLSDGTVTSVMMAENAGSITMEGISGLVLEGDLTGNAAQGYMGGELSLNLENEDLDLVVSLQDLVQYQSSGFDSLEFMSRKSIRFEDFNTSDGAEGLEKFRRLELDAPEISGSGQEIVELNASAVLLANTGERYSPTISAPDPGDPGSLLSLLGDYMDVEGSIRISGFEDVILSANRYITFSDLAYITDNNMRRWEGLLKTPSNLHLIASCIYPTTQSDFTIRSENSINIMRPTEMIPPEIIYSAGGRLTLESNRIVHESLLAAPMGEIVLRGTGDSSRIYLADGSRISVKGAVDVEYGTLDDTYWEILDKSDRQASLPEAYLPVDEVPVKAVTISGDEVIMSEGAEIDLSGGAGIVGRQFQPGTGGSVNPFDDGFVILPSQPDILSGQAVYLAGTDSIPKGYYSVLSQEYAFLPGAIFVTQVKGDMPTGSNLVSAEGYPVVLGYETEMMTNVQSPVMQAYVVRPAAAVAEEGYFNVTTLESGDSGNLSILANTTVLDGTITADPLAGYAGGILELGGRHVTIGAFESPLPPDFGPDDALPAELLDSLMLKSASITGSGFNEIQIGNIDSNTSNTLSIRLIEDSALEVANITLAAADMITVESGARISSLGEQSTCSLISPEGTIHIEEGALVQSPYELNIEAMALELAGEVQVDHILNISGQNLCLIPEGYSGDLSPYQDSLQISPYLWDLFAEIDNVSLTSKGDLLFLGQMDMAAGANLVIDAARIGMSATEPNAVSLTSPDVRIQYTGTEIPEGNDLLDLGHLIVSSEQMSIGNGAVDLDGFASVQLLSTNGLVFEGEGSLTISGNLEISAGRVGVAYYSDDVTSFETAQFLVDAGDNAIRFNQGGATSVVSEAVGGSLKLTARTIESFGVFELPGGKLSLLATGTGPEDGIFIGNGSEILAYGGVLSHEISGVTQQEAFRAGSVDLTASGGRIVIAEGALIDVSNRTSDGMIPVDDIHQLAGAGILDGGSLQISAPADSMILDGTLLGNALFGQGGSFTLDVNGLSDMPPVFQKLESGGFNRSIDMRIRTGNVILTEAVTAHEFKLVADAGNLDIHGTIDAAGQVDGGQVELYAGADLRLYADAGYARIIDVSAVEGQGGSVVLGSTAGNIVLDQGVEINVSGSSAENGGTVSFRAPRVDVDHDGQDDSVGMVLNGTVTGASRITAEAVRVYDDTDHDGRIDSEINVMKTHTDQFMTHADAIEQMLTSGLDYDDSGQGDIFQLLPGVEIQSQNSLTLATDWNLTQWLDSGSPGVLTLRSAGDLNLHASLTDAPTSLYFLYGTNGWDSWAINLTAGAGLDSADRMAVDAGVGDLWIGNGYWRVSNGQESLVWRDPDILVYTESADISFASGGDTLMGSGDSGYMTEYSMKYSLASYNGTVRGYIRGNLIIDGGAIQSATGDIELKIGQDLELDVLNGSAIRTTGEIPLNAYWQFEYWNAANGGNIDLDVGGDVRTTYNSLNANAWDNIYLVDGQRLWGANYITNFLNGTVPTAGIATMAGGDIAVSTGGDFQCQIGTFGQGDLTVLANGDMDGRFLIHGDAADTGLAMLRIAGSFGALPKLDHQSIELFYGNVDLLARGDIQLGTVYNPTIAREGLNEIHLWNLTYDVSSSVSMMTPEGDIEFSGIVSGMDQLAIAEPERYRLLPSVVEMVAGGDIRIERGFSQTPSPDGNLRLISGGDISGSYIHDDGSIVNAQIYLSDLNPESVYGRQDGVVNQHTFFSSLEDPAKHAAIPIHLSDSEPIEICAAQDIKGLKLNTPKKSVISAGGDIMDLYYFGQNVNLEDTTVIQAGGDISLISTSTLRSQTGFKHGGPGLFLVMAGDSLDLGTSEGIQMVGNFFNASLGDEKSAVGILTGYTAKEDVTMEALSTFFDDLREIGKEYSALLAIGDLEGADEMVTYARTEIIGEFLEETDGGSGNVEMTRSQINTKGSLSDIHILAMGDINVGRTTFTESGAQDDSGIYTAQGGLINVLCGGDLNVNESRMMTFGGGDITVWSIEGNINAGRGSKTAINVEPPQIIREIDPDTGQVKEVTLVFQPPAVGKGIRTLTFDPDGLMGPLEAPLAGDVFLFAPEGEIDAGEAGISGRNVILGATRVLNAENISFSVGSIGVPSASEGGGNIGALAGTSGLTEASNIAEESAVVGSAQDRFAKYVEELSEALKPKWLDVKVIDYIEEEKDEEEE